MGKKIICPFHLDTNPSMHVYGEWSHCHVCLAHVRTSELGLDGAPVPRKDPTNVPKMIQYIRGLPIKSIRGLQLPFDDRGYYIVWPDGSFYKRRNWDDKTRYIAPAGVNQPIFTYPTNTAKHLLIVEGEINAISIHDVVYGDYKVCSPGPATNFMRYIKYYTQFERITIIADRDAPGVVFGDSLKQHLLKLHKRVNLILLEKDFNQVLQESGEQGVLELFEKVRV